MVRIKNSIVLINDLQLPYFFIYDNAKTYHS